MSVAEEVRALKELHIDGTLTDAEFTEAKAAVFRSVGGGGARGAAGGSATTYPHPLFSEELIAASKGGDSTRVAALLSEAINGADGNGWTAMHHAIAGGHTEMVDSLIRVKADVRIFTILSAAGRLRVSPLSPA